MTSTGTHEQIMIPVGAGELIDKITILEIKQQNVRDAAAKANIEHELTALRRIAEPLVADLAELPDLQQSLRSVNQTLWDIEDDIRDCERRSVFDQTFVSLARSVYKQNDERARIKQAINRLANSQIVEEKLYAQY